MRTKRLELLIKQYDLAISLWNSQHQAIWAMFNNVMLANSIFVAAIAFLFSQEKGLTSNTALILCVAGFLINLIWLVVNSRGYSYQKIRIKQAENYENNINKIIKSKRFEKFDLVESAAKYSQKGYKEFLKERFDLGFGNRWCRRIKTEWATFALICIFVIIYLVIFLFFYQKC